MLRYNRDTGSLATCAYFGWRTVPGRGGLIRLPRTFRGDRFRRGTIDGVTARSRSRESIGHAPRYRFVPRFALESGSTRTRSRFYTARSHVACQARMAQAGSAGYGNDVTKPVLLYKIYLRIQRYSVFVHINLFFDHVKEFS